MSDNSEKCVKSDTDIDSSQTQALVKPKKRNKATEAKLKPLIAAYLDVSQHVSQEDLAKRYKLDPATVADILRPFYDERAKRLDKRIERNVKRMADHITADAPVDYIEAMTIYKDTLERLKSERAHVLAFEDTDDIKALAERAKLLRSIESQMFNVLWRIDGQKNINVKTLAPLGVSTAGGGASGDIDRRTTIYNLYIKSVNVSTPDALSQHDADKKEIEADFEEVDDGS